MKIKKIKKMIIINKLDLREDKLDAKTKKTTFKEDILNRLAK